MASSKFFSAMALLPRALSSSAEAMVEAFSGRACALKVDRGLGIRLDSGEVKQVISQDGEKSEAFGDDQLWMD